MKLPVINHNTEKIEDTNQNKKLIKKVRRLY